MAHTWGKTMRKTRIVCVSDTHNQTPSLPKGDVLIHAGDLTNQGTLSELQKTVTWLSKADFEAKIVVAGNHDITLDAPFYAQHWPYFHNQRKQDSEACLALLTSSPSVTYLQHSSTHVKLDSPNGPHTHFKVFGSPYSPAHGLWAFGYKPDDAAKLWDEIPQDSDIVISHGPPKNHCDTDASITKTRAGCELLRQALWKVKPRLAVCGHMHEGRGAELIKWDPTAGFLELATDVWLDPGRGDGNKKQSLVNLVQEDPEREGAGAQLRQLKNRAISEKEYTSTPSTYDGEAGAGASYRAETCVVNAAIMAKSWGGPKRFNKPVVVDIELPVWQEDEDG